MTDLTEQQITSLAKLREPFPQAEIRYLPRVWCGACRDMKGACKNHQRTKCQKCRNNISSAHIDLAYVGHAEATNRLLNTDPAWKWEPVALDEKGLPQHDHNGGLWIRLTVCGVTRLGYGNAEGKRGGDAVKEIIGDAIRNAGMRFGMALDLWTSSDLEIAEAGPKDDAVSELRAGQRGGATAVDPPVTVENGPAPYSMTDAAAAEGAVTPEASAERAAALDEMRDLAKSINFADGLDTQFKTTFGHSIEQGTAAEFREATDLMRGSVAA